MATKINILVLWVKKSSKIGLDICEWIIQSLIFFFWKKVQTNISVCVIELVVHVYIGVYEERERERGLWRSGKVLYCGTGEGLGQHGLVQVRVRMWGNGGSLLLFVIKLYMFPMHTTSMSSEDRWLRVQLRRVISTTALLWI